MRMILLAWVVLIVVAGGAYEVLMTLQRPAIDAFATAGARVDPPEPGR